MLNVSISTVQRVLISPGSLRLWSIPRSFSLWGMAFKIGSEILGARQAQSFTVTKNRLSATPVQSFGTHITFGAILKPWAISVAYDLRKGGEVTTNHLSSRMVEFDTRLANSDPDSPQVVMETLQEFLLKQYAFKELNSTFQKIVELQEDSGRTDQSTLMMAERAGVSQKTYIKVFTKHMGVTPLAYAHYSAVVKSLPLLVRGAKPTAQIALELGFYDQSHFNRVFRSIMHMTPNQYRKSFREG